MAAKHEAVGLGAGRAHDNAILIGKHAVVYRRPAIPAPLPALSVEAAARFARPSGPRIAGGQTKREWCCRGTAIDLLVRCAIRIEQGLGYRLAGLSGHRQVCEIRR
jgi:hypothetical protein